MRRSFLTVLFAFLLSASWAHPWKPKHYVIVDSDGGLDDLKAICLLMSSPDVRLLGISVSDGFFPSEEAYARIRALADSLHHEGLGVASGTDRFGLIRECLGVEPSRTVFVSLGSLETVAECIEKIPLFSETVKQIFWSNSGLPGNDGLNYSYGPDAARAVLGGSIPVMVTGSAGDGFYDSEIRAEAGSIMNPAAKAFSAIIESNSNHSFALSAFDDMIPVLIHYPELFTVSGEAGKAKYFSVADIKKAQNAVLTILRGETARKMQVMKEMPTDTAFYQADMQKYALNIISRHGEDEWSAGVLANEMHRHLGVFAIIGVKMGIRAMEYFCSGIDEMKVTSMAGSVPPVSCMNDGLQLSTGATAGHGLLTVVNGANPSPSAEFSYRGRTIRLTLKKNLSDKMLADLGEISFVNGLDSDIYWELVRQKAIYFWADLDRHDIFDLEIIK